MVRRFQSTVITAILAALFLVTVTPLPAAAQAETAPASPDVLRATIQGTMVELTKQGKQVGRRFAPLRRGAPADTTRWDAMDGLYEAVAAVAATATELRSQADRLQAVPGFEPTVRLGELRQRRADTDSLIAAAQELVAHSWRAGLPPDPEESRLALGRRALMAKQLADRLVARTSDLAYGLGVTEGVGAQSLTLSVVGILVVFSVLFLISMVVGGIRKLDDGWKVQEKQQAADALTREPTIDETTVVPIAAACATVITGRHRVRKIRRLLSPKTKRTPWSAQGRLILQGSHAVGRKQN
jgi:Na+-transporting methylmalonyl-CoA/oxaloacetate decarboxylase gamma subunit